MKVMAGLEMNYYFILKTLYVFYFKITKIQNQQMHLSP